MGREGRLVVRHAGQSAEARVHLDSAQLEIGPPFRLKLPLAAVATATASADGLAISAPGMALVLDLPEKQALAWAKAMLNPPSLASKLGLKPGLSVATVGPVPAEIAVALKNAGDVRHYARWPARIEATVALAFWRPADAARYAAALPPKGALWLIYEKGAVNGDALIHVARKAGLKDTKVARINEVFTALRFVAA